MNDWQDDRMRMTGGDVEARMSKRSFIALCEPGCQFQVEQRTEKEDANGSTKTATNDRSKRQVFLLKLSNPGPKRCSIQTIIMNTETETNRSLQELRV